MSKQVQHFLYLFGIFYAELINQAGAALLGNYGTGNAAAGIQLLCQLGNALVFGLQNHAAVIKILAKAGNRVSCCGNTAATHDFAVQYLVFNVLGKTHVWCSHSLYREIWDVSGRAAGIAVLHAGLVTKLCAVLPDLAGKSDRTVLAAGAANGDHQLAFALLNIQRQRIFQS